MMNQSEQINELAEALAVAQGKLENPHKNKTADAGKFGYKYVDLASVIDTVRQPLSEVGLSYVQMPNVEDGMLYVVTRLMHKSGQWIEGRYPCASGNMDHQRIGSAISYGRRYSLCAVLGIAADDDNDGADADRVDFGKRNPTQERERFESKPEPEPEDPRDIHDRLVKALDTCTTLAELDAEKQTVGFVRDYNTLAKVYSESGFAEAVAAHAKKRKDFLTVQAAA